MKPASPPDGKAPTGATRAFAACLAAVLLVSLLPAVASSQCMFIHTIVNNGYPSYVMVTKVLSGHPSTIMCNVTSPINAFCYVQLPGFVPGSTLHMCPSGGPYCAGFTATFSTATHTMAPHACHFTCTGCPVVSGGPGAVVFTIDGSDGLPIELMDFSIESGDSEEAGDSKQDR